MPFIVNVIQGLKVLSSTRTICLSVICASVQGKKSFITLTQVFKAFAGQHGGWENTAGTNLINFLDIKFTLAKTLSLYV
jgi:hypothetical protein